MAGDPGHERQAADKGLLGDKIAVRDPAAAPMQTDAESAGAPTGRGEAARSVGVQKDIAARHPAATHFGAHEQPRGDAPGGIGAFLAVTVAALVALGVIAGALTLLG
jgi:hypothetical protein